MSNRLMWCTEAKVWKSWQYILAIPNINQTFPLKQTQTCVHLQWANKCVGARNTMNAHFSSFLIWYCQQYNCIWINRKPDHENSTSAARIWPVGQKKRQWVCENLKNSRFSPAFTFTCVGCIAVVLLCGCSTPYKVRWGIPTSVGTPMGVVTKLHRKKKKIEICCL